MNTLHETWSWLSAPAQWSGTGSIPTRLLEHLALCSSALLISALIAIPLGFALGHSSRAAHVLRASAITRAVPTLGTIALVGALFSSGMIAPVIALIILAFPTLLVGALSGVAALPQDVSEATAAMGMTRRQAIMQVELPLCLPSLVAALRASALQVVSTATLCAYVRSVGLGAYLFDGLNKDNNGELFGCTILIVALVLLLDTLLSALGHAVDRRMRFSQSG